MGVPADKSSSFAAPFFGSEAPASQLVGMPDTADTKTYLQGAGVPDVTEKLLEQVLKERPPPDQILSFLVNFSRQRSGSSPEAAEENKGSNEEEEEEGASIELAGQGDVEASLASAIADLANSPLPLATVDLSQNQIRGKFFSVDLAPFAGSMKSLNVSECQLKDDLMPTIVESLPNLTHLDISDNGIVDLTALAGLTQLKSAHFYKNSIATLPPAFCAGMPNLQELNLFNNAIAKVPPELGQITSLTEINLGANKMMTMPAGCLKGLSNLKRLALQMCKLVKLGATLEDLVALEELQINSNRLAELPTFGPTHPALKSMIFSGNQVSSIPDDLLTAERFPALEVFEISGNLVAALPDSMGALPSITQLNLSDNKLTALPEALWAAKTLEKLQLGGNQLSGTLPDGVATLPKLSVLLLPNNKLTGLPVSLGRVETLLKVSVKGNPLSPDQADILSAIQAQTAAKGRAGMFVQ
eukprot:NODE_1221_length_1515_cov_6.562756_g1016_i0.p1 GENE.NODE_1221_length_1515_cov_6.562756_g1016_i0~~NODE_1221_length_1515_cov_6.562756_g1016_i0.p1  ORF type:complete len:486 (-),score=91.51 NODE_1221_length_1515_cov_6.562756_g1016_i0:56-1471(-)